MAVFEEGGTWYVRFQVDGTRIRKAIKEARTKTQAEKAERAIRNQLFERKWGETGLRLFSNFVEKTYTPFARQHKKGFRVEKSVLATLDDCFGSLRLGDITPQLVLQFQNRRANEITNRGRKRSKATVNRDMAVLSAIMKLALNLGEIRENPVNKIKYFGNLPKRDRVLTDAEEIRLLEGIRDDRDLAHGVEFLLYTGLRRGEMFKLQWRDIDLDSNRINLRAETTKTSQRRTVPILSNVRKILIDRSTDSASPNSLIFDGTAQSLETAFSLRFREACTILDLEGITAHTLRHTFSTRANRFGVDPFAQKEALGHAKLTQTSDYTHQSSETFDRNFAGFEEYLLRRNGEQKNNLVATE